MDLLYNISVCGFFIILFNFDFWCFNATFNNISAISYGDQFQWWRKPGYPKRTTDHGQATGKLNHLRLRVECTLFSSPGSTALPLTQKITASAFSVFQHYSMGYCKMKIYNLGGSQELSFVYLLLLNLLILLIQSGLLTISLFQEGVTNVLFSSTSCLISSKMRQ